MRQATFDIETDGLLDTVTRVWCGVVKDHESGERYPFGPEDVQQLLQCLSGYDIICGHHCIGFDLPVLRRLYGFVPRARVVDTLLISRVQRPDRVLPPHCPRSAGPHSVQAWGYRVGRGKVEYEQWDRFTPAMLHRCEEDVEIQYLALQELIKEGRGENWRHCHRLNAKLFTYLQLQEEYGWQVDMDHMEWCLDYLNRTMDRIKQAVDPRLPVIAEPLETKELGEYKHVKKPFLKSGQPSASTEKHFGDGFGVVGGPFSRVAFRRVDIDKSAELKTFLLNTGWEPDEWNYDKDGNRTSPKLSKDDDFTGVQGSLGRLVARRVQCKQRRGIIEGWRTTVRDDGRIPTAVSGLASTGRVRHAGVVNVPSEDSGAFFGRNMRRIFCATPGMVMVGVDSKGNQQRQLVARCKMPLDHPYAMGVIHGKKEDGTDEHSAVQRMAGLPTRTLAKNVGYGTLFGAGDAKIGKLINAGPAEGKALKAKLFAAVHGLEQLLADLSEQWRATAKKQFNPKNGRVELRNGWITGLDGRPIQVESEHMLLVYLLQSDEAIQMAYAYCWFHEQMEARGYVLHRDWGMLIWYHDEYQFECRPDIVEEAAALAEESIAEAGRYFNIWCPHEGEAKSGYSWAETH